jgi:hypothetical protein
VDVGGGAVGSGTAVGCADAVGATVAGASVGTLVADGARVGGVAGKGVGAWATGATKRSRSSQPSATPASKVRMISGRLVFLGIGLFQSFSCQRIWGTN